ncbi:MAG: lipoyl(octanoyl) transferase LipB, partial [Thermodesulfobacteriota bacterium]
MKPWLRVNPVLPDEPTTVMSIRIEQLGLTPYRHGYEQQMRLVEKLHQEKSAPDTCLVLEHPSVFTIGRNGAPDNVTVGREFLRERGIELIRIERGGEVTYHGPGQIVCYPIINLRKNKLSVVEFVHSLEQIMLAVVHRFGIDAARDARNHGIWAGDRKLGSVGIAVRHGISYHGLALNVNPDLGPFDWMNPCGLTEVAMSSMEKELQQSLDIKEVEQVMIEEIGRSFGVAPQEKVPGPGKCRSGNAPARAAKPKWLKQRLPSGPGYEKTRRLVRTSGLHTVCQEARCPNQFECFGKGAATFMLMGEHCTRNCRFCAVT